MKKAFLLFLMLIIACFTIIGCKDSSNNTNNSSNANVGVLRDLSVNLEKNYSVPDSDSNVIELASTPDELYQNDLKKLISISDDVIRVTVQNVAYTSYEGVAWTKLKENLLHQPNLDRFMEKLYDYLPQQLVTFILVTLFSLLIGLSQRRISLKREGETTLFGTDRTFTFIGILGYLLYILDPKEMHLFMGGGIILGMLLGINYYV